MYPPFGEIEDIRPANIVLTEDGVYIHQHDSEAMFHHIIVQQSGELRHHKRMSGNRTWTHGNLSIDEFQPHAGRVFPQLKELPSRHLDRAEAGHATIIA